MSLPREKRKLAHLAGAVELGDGPGTTGFEDIHLVHNALPELDWEEIDLHTTFCGKTLTSPIFINAMTGGAREVKRINAALAHVAARRGLAMAVGSQTAALEDPGLRDTFQVVREVNPDGFIMANVGAHVPVEWAVEAVDMIRADALQVHLNVPQEMAMTEGERCFRGSLERIAELAREIPVPVVVKEVGFGIAREEAARLIPTGIRAIDVGGKGGTNFIAIELARRSEEMGESFLEWGLPTAVTLVEVVEEAGTRVDVAATGGIRRGLDAGKALALGARAVGIAGPLVRLLAMEEDGLLEEELSRLERELRLVMLMTGARTVEDLRRRPVVITGRTAEWLSRRGINLSRLSARG